MYLLGLLIAFGFRPYSGAVSFYHADTAAPVVFKAKDHKGKNTLSTSGVISFTTGLDNDNYLVDSFNKKIYFYVETKLAKLINLPLKRTPLNISIVIDRSGSMQGVKMGYAKKAAKGIVDQLQPSDFVSVVMYDNAIDSVQEPIAVTNKELIKAKIDKITPRGSTNLWGGTEKGYDYVRKNYKPGFINRVLLISDGLANIGITDSSVIHRKVQEFKDNEGISLSTFGVGLDYNETLMTDMAETGAGNYYFIDAPDHMMAMFEKELSGMLHVVAQNAEISIKLPKGVKIEKSYPMNYSLVGDVLVLKLRDLFEEETRSTLLQFSVQDRTTLPLKFISTLSYTDVLDGKQKTTANENSLTPTKSPETYLTHFNKDVIDQAILYTANEKLEQAMNQVDNRDFNGSRQSLETNRNFLKANNYYVKSNRGLQVMDSVNTRYSFLSSKATSLPPDSLKKIQKYSREANYQVRNKRY
jgi:Ca-activated chloride channel family protein